MEVKERIKIPYYNDIFFKYCFGTNNQDSKELREYLLTKITNTKFAEVVVLNPDINPNTVTDKHIVLDIHAREVNGTYINIEMQISRFSSSQYLRFQYYSAKILTKQIIKGEKYDNLHQVYEIVLIDDIDGESKSLITHYVLKNQENKSIPYSLLHIYFVQLPMINRIVDKKGIEGLTEFEKMIYLFKNGGKNSILKVIKDKERMVKKMIEKYEEFTFDPELWSVAEAIEKGKMMWNGLLYDYKQEGIELGKQEGRQEGKQEGTKETVVKVLTKRYGKNCKQWVDTLTTRQLDRVLELFLEEDNLEVLKSRVVSR